MGTPITLPFVREKIHELRQGLFCIRSESLLRIPNCVIQALSVDEVGQIWFLVSRPRQEIREFDKEFPATLDFVRKGAAGYLKILGMAHIVCDPEEINFAVGITQEAREAARLQEAVLIKLKIRNVDYFNLPAPKLAKSRISRARIILDRWFSREKQSFRLDHPGSIPVPALEGHL
jgi:hypothetical protein